MKHGRRHDKLKEQAYKARKKAKGYATPYDPIDVTPPSGAGTSPPAADDEEVGRPAASLIHPKTAKALRRLGIDPVVDGDTT